MDIMGQLAHIIAYDGRRHHIHVLKMGHGKFSVSEFNARILLTDKNTRKRLALQYGRLQGADEKIKRNYTITVSVLLFL